MQNTVTKGDISAIREEDGKKLIQISASISYGSSGGVLLDNDGYVIGVTSAGLIEGQNLNFAIPIKVVQELYDHWDKKSGVELGTDESWDTVNYYGKQVADHNTWTKENTESETVYIDNDAEIQFAYPSEWYKQIYTDSKEAKELMFFPADSYFVMIEYSSDDMWAKFMMDPEMNELFSDATRDEFDYFTMDEEIAEYYLDYYTIEKTELKKYGSNNFYIISAVMEDDAEEPFDVVVAYFSNNGYIVTFTMMPIGSIEDCMPAFERVLESVKIW